MILHDTIVGLTPSELKDLPEYSTSLPTGTTIGKKWKRKKKWSDPESGWMMGEYIPSLRKGYVNIRWRHVVVLEPTELIQEIDPDLERLLLEEEEIEKRMKGSNG